MEEGREERKRWRKGGSEEMDGGREGLFTHTALP